MQSINYCVVTVSMLVIEEGPKELEAQTAPIRLKDLSVLSKFSLYNNQRATRIQVKEN